MVAFLDYFKLPLAGYRFYSSSNPSNVGRAGSYWLSSTAPTNAGGYNKARYFTTYLSQNSTYLRIGSNSRTYGFSVRCFRDVYEAPVVVYTVSFDTGTGTITVDSQEIESGSTVSQPITQLTGYTAIWYLDSGFVTPFDFDTPIT